MVTNISPDAHKASDFPRGFQARNSSPFSLLQTAAIAIVGLIAFSSSSMAAGPDDAQILGIYIQVNSFDIETALLGRAQGGSDGVKKLAEHVSSDHLGVRQAAQSLATKCNVTPALPTDRNAAMNEHGQALTTLSSLKGAAFDKAYLEHEVAFHRGAINAIRTVLLPASTCPALQAHFKEILPALEQHLAHTEELAKEKGVKINKM